MGDLTMITEDYVSFEVAKLLKEKGFDERCFSFYWSDGSLDANSHDKKTNLRNSTSSNPVAPTLQMAMKWLREVHNIALNVCYFLGMWSYSVYRTDVNSSGYNSEDFDTYEEACEAGIKFCLENLI